MVAPNSWLVDLVNLFFPLQCQACGNVLFRQEEVICFKCLIRLPRTNFHLHEENPVSRMFWGRIPIHAAASFLFFNKGGKVQQLIHQLKYKGQTKVGLYLGKMYGESLLKSHLFADVELVIPVPLHPRKQHQRGFNQSEVIARGLSSSMHIPCVSDQLIRRLHTATQTRKSRYERWENVKSSFQLNRPEELAGKHLLLVDDVITTGATLEACAQVFGHIPNIKLSVVSLAYAQV